MKIYSANKVLSLTLLAIAATACTASTNATNQTAVNNANNAIVDSPTAAASPTTPPPAAAEAPEAVVADLYKQHAAQNTPFYQTKNRAAVDKYFTKATADLIWKDALDSEAGGGVGALGADPLYDAQDTDIKKFAVGKAQITGSTAAVPVTFTNFGKKQLITYTLAEENKKWKIADIKYDSADYTLVSLLKESAASAESPRGEFEGKYKIGDTTCTVKPIKMAFEVKWTKGTGTEIFIFQDRANDKYIFASDPDAGKANVFSFDDENYNTGTFYRADGKEFPITRAK